MEVWRLRKGLYYLSQGSTFKASLHIWGSVIGNLQTHLLPLTPPRYRYLFIYIWVFRLLFVLSFNWKNGETGPVKIAKNLIEAYRIFSYSYLPLNVLCFGKFKVFLLAKILSLDKNLGYKFIRWYSD